jgi:hypothetical protein
MALGGGVAIRGGATTEVGCWAEFCNMGRVIGAQRRKDQVGKDNLAVGAQMRKWRHGGQPRKVVSNSFGLGRVPGRVMGFLRHEIRP